MPSDPLPPTESPLDERVIAEEARIQLHEALARLAEPQRSILRLRLQGLTGPEIADRLGMNHEAMKSAQYRAMAKLRVALRHLNEQDESGIMDGMVTITKTGSTAHSTA